MLVISRACTGELCVERPCSGPQSSSHVCPSRVELLCPSDRVCELWTHAFQTVPKLPVPSFSPSVYDEAGSLDGVDDDEGDIVGAAARG